MYNFVMCTSPNRVFYTGLKTETGKDLLFFDAHYPVPDEVSVESAEKSLKVKIPYNPEFVALKGEHLFLIKHRDIPCGKCDQCRMSKAKEWAFRCLMEAQYHDENWFVTLTFSDDWLPEKVQKKDVSMFMKRLRTYTGLSDLKFFACGEYGEGSGRPHYHLIIFGLKLGDLKVWDKSQGLYTSDVIMKAWPYGMSVVAAVTMESVCYVARYTSDKTAEKFGFNSMSNRPGLGYRYILDHQDSLPCDYYSLFVDGSLKRVKPPRYAEKLLDHLDWTAKKDQRVWNAERSNSLLRAVHGCSRTGLDDYQRKYFHALANKNRKEKL